MGLKKALLTAIGCSLVWYCRNWSSYSENLGVSELPEASSSMFSGIPRPSRAQSDPSLVISYDTHPLSFPGLPSDFLKVGSCPSSCWQRLLQLQYQVGVKFYCGVTSNQPRWWWRFWQVCRLKDRQLMLLLVCYQREKILSFVRGCRFRSFLRHQVSSKHVLAADSCSQNSCIVWRRKQSCEKIWRSLGASRKGWD